MIDRLVDLINQANKKCRSTCCDDCSAVGFVGEGCVNYNIADHLLANGVVVPPCKVGVEVYFASKEKDRIFKGELISFSLDAAHFWFFCRYYCGLSLWHQVEDFGKTVFLTGEEAEQALKEKE
jgi:hypothetical protein